MDNNQSLISKHAKSFSWAGFFLSKETFNKCSILYDFCRSVDDIVDGDETLDVRQKKFIEFKLYFMGAIHIEDETYKITYKYIKNVFFLESKNFRLLRNIIPANKNILYAGTETGMYISFNAGKSWNEFQLNLPIVPITDLTIKNNSLVVATQGRSLWMIDDLTVLHQSYISQLDKDMLPSNNLHENFLYKPKDTYRIAWGKSNRNKLTEGENLDNGVITYFNIPTYTENDEVSLTYLNTNRDTIVSFGTKLKEKNWFLH